ncbi:uncharacterized protein LOC121879863 [Homarus americanus]|uniref:uncharacterized protein LOC121879863 n=1 Tax=Homarus americanus TaxID=6706 RepID=UPI001C461382|nr:uncharacterized protein LOC121879863 [Homarus americanus]
MGGHVLTTYGLPRAPHVDNEQLCREYRRETNYNQEELAVQVDEQYQKLTEDQRSAYTAFLEMVNGEIEDHNNIMFLDAPGGTVPEELGKCVEKLEDLKARVYPDLSLNGKHPDWLAERAIVSPLNANVNKLNKWLMSEFPGQEKVYKSIDTTTNDDEAVQYPTDFLNSIELSGMPPHLLKVKVGSPIMILRSLDPPQTINGTRCVVTRLHENLIEATIIFGPYKGQALLIPRIPLIPSDSELPFAFRRLQFPVRPCFAMSINKSQGQTFKTIDIDLTNPCFSHGMFYVVVSRTGTSKNLYILANQRKTRNVVLH